MVTVARVSAADQIALDDINALLRELRTDAGEPLGSPEDLAAILSNADVLFVVARDGDKTVGMGTIYLGRKFGKTTGFVEDVVVSEAYRGQKLGQKIMETLMAEAKAKGATQLYLTSRPERVAAHGLYLKLGFKKKETTVFQYKY